MKIQRIIILSLVSLFFFNSVNVYAEPQALLQEIVEQAKLGLTPEEDKHPLGSGFSSILNDLNFGKTYIKPSENNELLFPTKKIAYFYDIHPSKADPIITGIKIYSSSLSARAAMPSKLKEITPACIRKFFDVAKAYSIDSYTDDTTCYLMPHQNFTCICKKSGFLYQCRVENHILTFCFKDADLNNSPLDSYWIMKKK